MSESIPSLTARGLFYGVWCAPALWTPAQADQNLSLAAASFGDLTELSLEKLMEIEVFSVSKSNEPWRKAAAAIHVLTADDIVRSGVTTIPEALRLIPGVTVAQINAHTWAITARGFNSTLADKLEVLMDGRSLYTPLFSGVYWQKHNVPIADVDRIEVIRGPGAALWGSNAVNGVINIVTKSAQDTLGHSLNTSLANRGDSSTSVRGGYALKNGAIRGFIHNDRVEDFRERSGEVADDSFRATRAGFRADLSLSEQSALAIWGESYRDRMDRVGGLDEEQSTDYLMARYAVSDNGRERYEVHGFVERFEYDIPHLFTEQRDTMEVEARAYFYPVERHQIVVGGGYQITRDDIESPDLNTLGFVPDDASDETLNIYVQDAVDLIPERLKLTAGVKAERNDYSGVEVQPSLRVAWTPDADTTWWAAISRAVRIPTRLDEDFVIYAPQPFPAGIAIIRGSEDFDSEEVLAWEAGYRTSFSDRSNIDIAVFYNEYDELRGIDNSVQPALISNEGEGHSSGVELVYNWKPHERVLAQASYSYNHIDFQARRTSTDTSIATANRNDPRHQGMLRVSWALAPGWNLDMRYRNVSHLPDLDVAGYDAVDASLQWQATPDLLLGLSSRNLFDGQHPEFAADQREVEVPRTIQLQATWNF